MAQKTGYKGTLGFYIATDHNFISVWDVTNESEQDRHDRMANHGYVYTGVTIEADVQFPDLRQAAIESINKQIEKERAESQFRVNQMLGKIQELMAIESKPDSY